MFCKKCGTIIDDDALFCENCGTAVKRAEAAAPAPVAQDPVVAAPVEAPAHEASVPVVEAAAEPVAAEPAAEITPPAAPVVGVPPQYLNQPVAKPKKGLLKWIIIAAVAVVAVIAIVAMLLGGGGSGGNSDAVYHEINFNNVAHFAYDDSRLYFISEYNDDAEETSVFSTDYNGINKKMICDNGDIIRIRVIDGKIYYLESLDEGYRIGVMNTDGSSQRSIISTEDFVDKYAIQDDKLYYLTDSKLHMCGLDGSGDQVLLEGASTFVMGKKALYYVNEGVITVFDLKKGSSSQLCKAEGATDLALDNNILYFACDSGLCSVDVKGDGTVTRIINDTELDTYAFYGDYIYYGQDYDDEEIEDFAYYLAEDEDDIWTYKLLFIGAGRLYQANRDGSNVHEVENTDDTIVFALFNYPEGLYYKMFAFSDTVNEVEFE